MDCRVVVEAAVPVYDVETPDEAVRIAISKTGEMLNPDLNYVEINMGERTCPHCNEELETAFIAADESLVALELEMTVFNVEREEHASRIARKEIGQRLENIPLDVLEIEVLEDDDDEDEEDEEESAESEDIQSESEDESADSDSESSEAEEDVEVDETADVDEAAAGESDPVEPEEFEAKVTEVTDTENADEEVLPEFEELIDE